MKVSYRLHRIDIDKFNLSETIIPFIKDNIEAIDEIAIFTDINEHCYENPESIKKFALYLSDAIKEIKAAGVKSVGLNILNTVGQGDDAWSFVELSPFQTMVGHNGTTCYGSNCMRAGGFYEYMCKKYEIYASVGADFIWVDDDLRMCWHGVHYPCFCHNCIAKFNELCGTKYNRERLVDALENDADGKLRYKWLRYNADEMSKLLRVCAESAYKIDKNVKFGLMTCGLDLQLYNLMNLDEMMEAMKATMLRPGGGFWTAESPKQLFRKCRDISDQILQSKTGVDIQYESENIPHLESKPQKIHIAEMTAALMSGCNGIAIDQVMFSEPKYFKKILDLVKENRNMWERLTENIKDMHLAGGIAVYRKDALAKVTKGSFFDSPIYGSIREEHCLFDAGFSFTPNPDNADYFVLFGWVVDSLSDDEITELLKKSVIIDDLGLKKLIERGFGKYCGADSVQEYTNGIKEVYLAHDFNTAKTCMGRGGKQAQFRDGKVMYIPYEIDKNAEALCSCKSSITNEFCGIGSYIFENELGGRVAALCYAASELYEQEERVDLLRNIVKWLCHNKPSVEFSGAYNIMPILNESEQNDEFCLMITNAWLDDTSDILVKIKSDYAGKAVVYSSESKEYYEIDCENEDGICKFSIPPIKAWEFVIITAE